MEGGFFVTKIIELIDDFKIEQQVKGRKEEYIATCSWRLSRWQDFIKDNYSIDDVEEVKSKHIKQYIIHAQKLGREKAITINNCLATLRAFFKYLVEEEFINEFENPMRKIESLKEDKRVILTFNDDEVGRILNDVAEETYNNVRDKLMLIMLFDTGIGVSELCSIKNSDIARRHILIHGKGSKERMIYISKTMRRYMRKYEELKQLGSVRKALMKLKSITF